MAVLLGTSDGIYRISSIPFENGPLEHTLESVSVRRLQTFRGTRGVFAATDEGLFRSTDGGHAWTDLAVPGNASVWSVLGTDDGALFAGTDGPRLYRSIDDGNRWVELEGFRDLPSIGRWESPGDRNRARLRSLSSPPGHSAHIVAGVEVGGLHVSTDGDETWVDRRREGPDDVHRVVALSPEAYVLAAGYFDLTLEHLDQGHALALGGLHRTTDCGRSWRRLDRTNDFAYVLNFHLQAGRLCFEGARNSPPTWRAEGVDARCFESPNLGRTIVERERDREPPDLMVAWCSYNDTLLAGTSWHGAGEAPSRPGRVLRDTGASYEEVGTVPANVRALATAD